MRDENQWFDNAIMPAFERCVHLKSSDTINLDITVFDKLDQAVKRRIIRKAILSIKKDLRRITLLHVDAILDLVNNGAVTGNLSLPGGIIVKRNASDLIIVWDKKGRDIRHNKSLVSHTDDYQYTVSGVGILPLTNVKLSISFEEIGVADLPDFKATASHLAFFDMDLIHFPLIVRNVRLGDRFSPLGVSGTQKIKKYFIDKKIPAAQRKKCPLVLSKGRIIWIAGHRIDNSVKVGPQTRRVLRAELLLA
jgi:tRNA(Ile)-lysidine synthase